MNRRTSLLVVIFILVALGVSTWWVLAPGDSSSSEEIAVVVEDTTAKEPEPAVQEPVAPTPDKAPEVEPTPEVKEAATAAEKEPEPTPVGDVVKLKPERLRSSVTPSRGASKPRRVARTRKRPRRVAEPEEEPPVQEPVAKGPAPAMDEEPAPAIDEVDETEAPEDEMMPEEEQPAEDEPSEVAVAEEQPQPVVQGDARGIFHNRVRSLFQLDKVTCYIDGRPAFERSGNLTEVELFQSRLPVGDHLITVVAEYKGKGGVFFPYINSYRVSVKANQRFTVSEDQDAEVFVTAYKRSGITTKFEDRLALKIESK